jgi:20S proteasome subunit beta 1
MAVEYDGGVVMGADSRTSSGSYIANRVSDKITYVHDKVFVLFCSRVLHEMEQDECA